MAEQKCKIGKNRNNESDHTNHLTKTDSDRKEHSSVYDILSEGQAFTAHHRPRSYSLHSNLYITHGNKVTGKNHRQRRMSLPANEVKLRRHHDGEGTKTKQVERHHHSTEDAREDAVLTTKRSLSFKERSDQGGESHRRVRSFKTTSKGLVNRGDMYKVEKVAQCDDSFDKSESNGVDKTYLFKAPNKTYVDTRKSKEGEYYFRVLLVGSAGVGKTSLIDQFMTSEFIGNGALNISQSEGDRTITLQVDGEESTLEFVQSEDFQDQDESLQIDAFVVVYCITERVTFDIAIDLLKQIREEVGSNKAIILVGNKSDLVRKRTISQEEGRSAADGYGCKYIELSAALNHRVDELLVGIHKQIRLKSDADGEEHESKVPKAKERKSSFKRTKRFLEKVFLGQSGKNKKTENLYVD